MYNFRSLCTTLGHEVWSVCTTSDQLYDIRLVYTTLDHDHDFRSVCTTSDQCVRLQISAYDFRSVCTTSDQCARLQIGVYDFRSVRTTSDQYTPHYTEDAGPGGLPHSWSAPQTLNSVAVCEAQ